MRETGCTEEDLLSFLADTQAKDTPYDRILSSMCTRPHPLAVRVHTMFMDTNLGDPGLFQGTASLEQRLVKVLGMLLHCREAGGYATSGGTESNIQALRIARKLRKVTNPNIIIPASAHFSFEKACDMLCLEARDIPLDDHYRADIDRVERLIDQQTICMVGIAGSTEYGVVDPLEEMAAIADSHGIFFHVDAAFGGLVLPFIDGAPPFDFAIEGVSSISVDPHKMGMSTIPVGCFLVRDPAALGLLNIPTPYLTVKQGYTLSGTRSGGAVAGALAVLEYFGREGMKALVSGCMRNTRRLIDGMETFGYPVVVQPQVNVATFRCPAAPAGWHVSWTRHGHMRIVCMPHVHRDTIEVFLKDIGDICA